MRNGDAYFLGVGGYDGTNAVSATSKPLAAVLSAMKSYADTKASLSTDGYVPTSRKINGTQLTADINVGTVTGIKMNGASKGSSGVVDLGTVLTAHQSLTGYVPTSRKINGT